MTGAIKGILTKLGLLGPARRVRDRLKRPVRLGINRWIWLTTRFRGGSYTDFYERMMDHRARVGSLLGESALGVTGTPDERRRRFAGHRHGRDPLKRMLLDGARPAG